MDLQGGESERVKKKALSINIPEKESNQFVFVQQHSSLYIREMDLVKKREKEVKKKILRIQIQIMSSLYEKLGVLGTIALVCTGLVLRTIMRDVST